MNFLMDFVINSSKDFFENLFQDYFRKSLNIFSKKILEISIRIPPTFLGKVNQTVWRSSHDCFKNSSKFCFLKSSKGSSTIFSKDSFRNRLNNYLGFFKTILTDTPPIICSITLDAFFRNSFKVWPRKCF